MFANKSSTLALEHTKWRLCSRRRSRRIPNPFTNDFFAHCLMAGLACLSIPNLIYSAKRRPRHRRRRSGRRGEADSAMQRGRDGLARCRSAHYPSRVRIGINNRHYWCWLLKYTMELHEYALETNVVMRRQRPGGPVIITPSRLRVEINIFLIS